jgi:hypothetical protein
MSTWKKNFLTITQLCLAASSLIFVVTGYTALYWAWIRGNLDAARPYLPWARNFGMLALLLATIAFGILFSSKAFPISDKKRLSLSLLATTTIALFSEFRNEGKFCFKNLYHFFTPGSWTHEGLNRLAPSFGDFFYRVEYSHFNDFLLGPAVVSVLFPLAVVRIYRALTEQDSIKLTAPMFDESSGLDQALRFGRILMNVGLFWFFWQAWAEKAGYLSNPHSSDEIDLPFEFCGTMVGFWMARMLTKPFAQKPEKFRSTFVIDFVSSGVVGLLYTLLVGPLVEGVASAVGHSLYPVVPHALDAHVYTPFQRHIRPFELLLIAGATWWSLNRSSTADQITLLAGASQQRESEAKWKAPKAMVVALGAVAAYLAILAMMFALLEPQGFAWTFVTAGSGLAVGTAAFLLVSWAGRHGVTKLVDDKQDPPSREG